MKKVTMVIACLLVMLLGFSNQMMAQQKVNPYLGEWVLSSETPVGTTEMNLVVSMKDGVLAGELVAQDTTIPVESIVLTDDEELSFDFNGQGFQVNITLELKDKDNVTGTMMGSFPVTGKRKVATPSD